MLSLELRAYNQFLKQYNEGCFPGQRIGQAFYNEFKLHKMHRQGDLKGLYEKDGSEAINLINQIFILN